MMMFQGEQKVVSRSGLLCDLMYDTEICLSITLTCERAVKCGFGMHTVICRRAFHVKCCHFVCASHTAQACMCARRRRTAGAQVQPSHAEQGIPSWRKVPFKSAFRLPPGVLKRAPRARKYRTVQPTPHRQAHRVRYIIPKRGKCMGKRKGAKANVAVTEVSGKTTLAPQVKSPGVQKKPAAGRKEAVPSSKGFIDDLFANSKKIELPAANKQSKPDTSTAGEAPTKPKA